MWLRALLVVKIVAATSDCVGVCTCELADGPCPVNELSQTQSTAITADTGGCLLGLPYQFQYIPGRSNKVALIFRGSRTVTYEAALFSVLDNPQVFAPVIVPDGSDGVYEQTMKPFKDWTKISVPQCTGDAHLGSNSNVLYAANGFAGVNHLGYTNVQAVLDWIDNNGLCTDIDELALIGLSSGGIGASVLAKEIKDRCSAHRVTVIVDSSPAAFALDSSDDPDDCVGLLLNTQLLKQVGGCDKLPTTALQTDCANEVSVGTIDIVSGVIQNLGPDVLFLEIFSKNDEFIRDSLVSLGLASLEFKNQKATCQTFTGLTFPTPQSWYKAVNSYARAIEAAASGNYFTYFLDTTNHVALDILTLDVTLGDGPRPQVNDGPTGPQGCELIFNPFALPPSAGAVIFDAFCTPVASIPPPLPLPTDPIVGSSSSVLIPTNFQTISAGCDDLSCGYKPRLKKWLKKAFKLANNDDVSLCHECNGDPVTNFDGSDGTCDEFFADADCLGGDDGDEDEDDDEDDDD